MNSKSQLRLPSSPMFEGFNPGSPVNPFEGLKLVNVSMPYATDKLCVKKVSDVNGSEVKEAESVKKGKNVNKKK